MCYYYFKTALWIRIDFNAYPDPGSQTNADPDPSQALPSKKVEFLFENNRNTPHTYVGTMPF
jgi:hypothetical protein